MKTEYDDFGNKKAEPQGGCGSARVLEYIIILPKRLKYNKNIVLKQLQKNHTKILKKHEVNSFGAKKGQLGAESSENCPFLVVRKCFKMHAFAWFCRLLHKNVKI